MYHMTKVQKKPNENNILEEKNKNDLKYYD